MDKVYEELDETKAKIEKLKAELLVKTDSLENLKKSHNAQVNQIREAKFKVGKLDQELLQKEDEITEVKHICEDLKVNLNKKEAIIQHLSAANEKLKVDSEGKLKKWEDEKKLLVLALEEENQKAGNQEEQIYLYKQEIESLKSCLSVSKKKCSEIEKKSKSSKELRDRYDMLDKLEEGYRKVEDELKWKKEQFKHLEEAHEKSKQQFRSSKKEWELEKSALLDEISSLQNKLDSEIRITQELRHQLQTCNQVLAHVESQKKRLELEVLDFKAQFNDVSSEYEDARLQLQCLNSQRDKEIGDLRYSLKTKEADYKESRYRMEKLKQENQELRMSLNELHEAQIQEAGASYSQSKLRSKLRNLEQTHNDCVSNFKTKEDEWNFQLHQLRGDLAGCRSELEIKTADLEELKMELESSHSLAVEMKLLNEEMSVKLLVLREGIIEAQSRLAANHKEEMDLISKESEEKLFQLTKRLEMKDAALINAQKYVDEERQKAACLMRQLETYGFTEKLQHSLQNELDRHKEMLEESTRCQLLLKEKLLQMESDSKEQLRDVLDAMDSANIELDERIREMHELEFELQIWKSIVERLRNDLEQNHVMRMELETSLLAQVDFGESLKQDKDNLVYKLEEKEKRIDDLQQRLGLLEQELKKRDTVPFVSSEFHEVRYFQIIEEKDKILEQLQKEVARLEQESFRREFESAVIEKCCMERTNELEKENLIQLIRRKNTGMDELIQHVTSLEQQFTSYLTTLSLQLVQKQAEINLIQEACHKITASEILAILEIEERKLMVVELEDDIHEMQQKLKLQEENWSQSVKLALDIEAELDAKELKVRELIFQMENKLMNSDALIHELKLENKNLHENAIRLSSEREDLLGFVGDLGDKICEFSSADTQLMDMLRSMVQSFEDDCPGMNLKKDDGFLVKENMVIHSPTRMKKLEAISDVRWPFKELNS